MGNHRIVVAGEILRIRRGFVPSICSKKIQEGVAMKAGFIFANRTAARQILTDAERRRANDRPRHSILTALAALLTKLFSK